MATGVQRIAGKPHIRKYLADDATADFVSGDLVKLDSSGLLTIATAQYVLGIAMEDHPGTATDYVKVDIIMPGDEFLIHSSTTTATTDVGDVLDVDPTTTAVTTTSTSHDTLTVLGLYPGDATGTSGGRFVVSFNPECLQSCAYGAT